MSIVRQNPMCPACFQPLGGDHLLTCRWDEAMPAKVTAIRPEVAITHELSDIPNSLRRMADAIERGDDPMQDIDILLVVASSPHMPKGMVHSFGRRPSHFEATGMLFSAAARVP